MMYKERMSYPRKNLWDKFYSQYQQKLKHLKVNLIKNMNDLYNENYKILNKKHTNKHRINNLGFQ